MSVRIIAVINQKGGVGKTTTAFNLAHALARKQLKVTVLDADPQAHLTTSFGLLRHGQSGMDAVLLDDASINEVKVPINDYLAVVPAGERLGEMEFVSAGGAERGYRLRQALKTLRRTQDYVIIDCPPSSGLLGMNALLAAQELLIPVSSDFLSMQGLARLMGIIEHIEKALHRKTQKWLVVTRFQERRRLARQVRERLLEHFPGNVLKTPIRETVALAESPSFGESIFDYRAAGHGAEDYQALADDLVTGRTF